LVGNTENGFIIHDLGIDEQIKRGLELAILSFKIKFRKTKNKGIDSKKIPEYSSN